jgi:hypothetical protein
MDEKNESLIKICVESFNSYKTRLWYEQIVSELPLSHKLVSETLSSSLICDLLTFVEVPPTHFIHARLF